MLNIQGNQLPESFLTRFRIDLNTKIIANDVRVFLARAGKQGHMFEQVLEHRAIGPDLPMLGLDLRNGLDGDPNVEAKVKRARAYSSWLRQSQEPRGDRPSESVNDYHDVNRRPGHAQIDGIVRTYFQELTAGDVLIIPNPSYFGDAIIAELLPVGNATAKIPGTRRFEGFEFDGRRFGHFKKVKMADLPRTVIDLAKAPTGLAEIRTPVVKHRIFELGYDDFVLDDKFVSRIFTTERDFTSFDGNVLNALVTMVAKNVDRLEMDGADAHLLNLVQAVFEQLDHDDLQVKIDINSPGFLAVFDRSVVPLVIASTLSVFVSVGFDATAFAQNTVVEATNSRAAEVADVCSQDVGRLTENMLKLLSTAEEDFQRTCDLLREAHDNTGARTNVTVEVER
ncbi:hypothetical protein DOO74_01290 [Rhodobacteraceae bacterium AsT-22]|nr:hypothetical protein DOO74_01290 [Rhodobacteraceae bacterium AsT-22]